jgi:hypothetical protein
MLASTTATPNAGSSPLYYADFTVPASIDGDHLYLIWDFRDAIETELCYSEVPVIDGGGCCDCSLFTFYLNDAFSTATAIFTDINLTTFADDGFYSTGGIIREWVGGVLLPSQPCNSCSVKISLCFGPTFNDVSCNCLDSCRTPCNTYSVENLSLYDDVVRYYDCNGIYQEITVPSELGTDICSVGAPTSDNPYMDILFKFCGCGE